MIPLMTEWHNVFEGQAWRVSIDGIELQQVGTLRTGGDPLTMRGLWRQYRAEIQQWSQRYGVSVELLLATIATESAVKNGQRDPKQIRIEPHYQSDETTPHRISVGLTHCTIETAKRALGYHPLSREWLQVPTNNIHAAASIIRMDADRHGFDPIKVAACYNAGSLRESKKNRWHLVVTHDHLDRFGRWFGDAVHVIREGGGCARDHVWMLHAHVTGTL